MARKRLTPLAPARPDTPGRDAFGAEAGIPGGGPRPHGGPPIARVAGESAAEAALATLSDEVARARAEGRLIVALALEEIDESHLVRDRVGVDEAEMTVLMTSLAERGQQTAIEVVDLGEARDRPRYGLISGWRRLMALRRLHDARGEDRFATIKALVRKPEIAQDAYRAMVDENEIRVGLSHWERARIAVQAADIGLYPTVQAALRDLFSAASRAKRSKIGSFIDLYRALGDSLAHPTALPERLGLALAKAVEEDAGFAAKLSAQLAEAGPVDAAAEQAVLTAALAGRTARDGKPSAPVGTGSATPKRTARETPPAGIRLSRTAADRLELTGPGVDAALERALVSWLKDRQAGS